MPSTHEIDPAHRIVIVTVSGGVTDRSLFHLYDEIRDDPEIGSDFGLLIDLRQATGRRLTSAGVAALAQRPMMLSPEARRAVVVPSEFGVGAARMYNTLREGGGGSVRAFRDFEEARRWVAAREE